MIHFLDLKEAVEEHDKKCPDHGKDCACMDSIIQSMRRLFKAEDPECQRRLDYVIRSAVER